MSKKSDSELATKSPGGALAVSQYGDDAGGGFENQSQQDRSMPFLQVLQTGSPQCKPRDPKQIQGATAGMVINTVSGKLYDGERGFILIPSFTEHVFVEWVPRDDGGGFVGRHTIDSEIVAQARARTRDRRLKTPDGKHDLVETFYVYGLVFDIPEGVDLRKGFVPISELIDLQDGIVDPVIVPFTSTKITPYKHINTQIGMFRIPGLPHPQCLPPMWAFPLWATTKLEERPAGSSFNYAFKFAGGPRIEKELLLPRFRAPDEEFPIYTACRGLRDAVKQGMVKVDFSKQQVDDAAAGGGGKGGADDVPF